MLQSVSTVAPSTCIDFENRRTTLRKSSLQNSVVAWLLVEGRLPAAAADRQRRCSVLVNHQIHPPPIDLSKKRRHTAGNLMGPVWSLNNIKPGEEDSDAVAFAANRFHHEYSQSSPSSHDCEVPEPFRIPFELRRQQPPNCNVTDMSALRSLLGEARSLSVPVSTCTASIDDVTYTKQRTPGHSPDDVIQLKRHRTSGRKNGGHYTTRSVKLTSSADADEPSDSMAASDQLSTTPPTLPTKRFRCSGSDSTSDVTELESKLLLTTTTTTTSRGTQCDDVDGDDVDVDDEQVALRWCGHCGIGFGDDVLHTIHMGCHSVGDPFTCNVCAQRCRHKYEFYTHITRGHRTSPPPPPQLLLPAD